MTKKGNCCPQPNADYHRGCSCTCHKEKESLKNDVTLSGSSETEYCENPNCYCGAPKHPPKTQEGWEEEFDAARTYTQQELDQLILKAREEGYKKGWIDANLPNMDSK